MLNADAFILFRDADCQGNAQGVSVFERDGAFNTDHIG